MKTTEECKNELKDAIYKCASSINELTNVDVILKAADACEKLSRTLSYINQIKESEEK